MKNENLKKFSVTFTLMIIAIIAWMLYETGKCNIVPAIIISVMQLFWLLYLVKIGHCKHTGEWKKIGFAYNGFGETLHERTCSKCGKVQQKVL